MASTPDRENITIRLPPHVKRELEELFEPYERHVKRHIAQSDMVGALILRARRDRFGLLDDLAAYLDVYDGWRQQGIIRLPDV